MLTTLLTEALVFLSEDGCIFALSVWGKGKQGDIVLYVRY